MPPSLYTRQFNQSEEKEGFRGGRDGEIMVLVVGASLLKRSRLGR